MSQMIDEAVYYGRHYRLPGFSKETQQKLRSARVLIVGVGGLGCPAALYLAGAGVGTIALLDGDEVSATNLHRQVLFDSADVGLKKVEVAAGRLKRVNPHIQVEAIDRFADAQLLERLVPDFDLVLDGTDNFAAKFQINDACEAAGVPLVYGSIFQYEGQVSVFHLRTGDGDGYSYRDLFHDAPPPNLTQNCGEAGVIGVLPGVIGTMQATEAIKVLTGLGEPLSGQLFTFDALTATTRKLGLSRRLGQEAPCAADAPSNISYAQALQRLEAEALPPTLVDVRESHERDLASLGGLHIPLATLPTRLADIPADRDVIVYCKSGVRSAKAALYLRSVLPRQGVFSLEGGVDSAVGSGLFCR